MHVSTCAFPQLPFLTALSFEAEEWMVGEEEYCHSLALDARIFFFTSKEVKCKGRSPVSQFPLLCSQNLDNILSWRAVGQSNVSMTILLSS